jgi:hypothetical protein
MAVAAAARDDGSRASAIPAEPNRVLTGWRQSPPSRIDRQSERLERLHAEDRLDDVTDEDGRRRLPASDGEDSRAGLDLHAPSGRQRDRDGTGQSPDAARARAWGIRENVAPVSTSMRTVVALSADNLTRE